MVFRHISPAIALWLLKKDYIPADVCDIFGFSERSLQRWINNNELYDSPIPPPSHLQGRPRLLDATMTEDLFALLDEAPALFLDEIQEWLGIVHDIAISRTALHQNIRDCALTYKLLRKAASERDEAFHQVWMGHASQHWVGQQLVFVDESSKDDRTIYRHYGRATAGHRAEISANFV